VISRLRSFVALLLLALWLPATQHCGLEAAGLLKTDCHTNAATSPDHKQSPCDTDNCQSIESGAYTSHFLNVQIAPPVAFASLLDLPLMPRLHAIQVPLLAAPRTSPPPELAPAWRFIARAAPSPRAPCLPA
jgi:hypothetical protein